MGPRILFILKRGGGYGYSNEGTGLYNSTRFIVGMLRANGIDCHIATVEDNNGIDREVHKYHPTHVVISALWVVPSKFEILHKLHPRVKWIVRIHSELAFLAQEGVATDWIVDYARHPKVWVSGNSESVTHDLETLLSLNGIRRPVIYLPNFYPVDWCERPAKDRTILDVACFGAIRPLKNQLIQAVAALEYGKRTGKYLRFHINNRADQSGHRVLKNIRNLFTVPNAELVEHDWLPHFEFLELLARMDIGMQVSLSETFCIVAADMVNVGLPCVFSPQIKWASRFSISSPYDTMQIVNRMGDVMGSGPEAKLARWLNARGLKEHSKQATEVWLNYLK